MRASRLLAILILLQLRARLTAAALAQEFGVSVRTIYRDIDELSAAGVPVWGDRGHGGGFQLGGGFRTQLNGLLHDEAQTLFLLGRQEAAAALGLSAAAERLRNKLMLALPGDAAAQAARLEHRFHADPADWYHDAEPVPHLPLLAQALLEQRLLDIDYQSWTGRRRWCVEPLGLVQKAAAWYLVADCEAPDKSAKSEGFDRSNASKSLKSPKSPKNPESPNSPERRRLTLKVNGIRSVEPRDDRFDRPAGFDLAAHWQQALRDFDQRLRPATATLRASPQALAWLAEAGRFAADAADAAAHATPDADGWHRVELPIERDDQAARLLLALAPGIEVLAPASLRQRLHDCGAALARLHA